MAATMEEAMFIMINMYGYVCAYVSACIHMCMHMYTSVELTPTTLTITHPYLPGGPPETVNLIRLELIEINQFCLQI